jgi:hypothetical protein
MDLAAKALTVKRKLAAWRRPGSAPERFARSGDYCRESIYMRKARQRVEADQIAAFLSDGFSPPVDQSPEA